MILDNLELNTNPRLLIGGNYDYFRDNRGKTFSGVYLMKNIIDEKIYIGSTVNMRARIRKHINDARVGRHSNPVFQRAIDKYGIDNFFFYAVEELPIGTSAKECQVEEQRYLDALKCFTSNGLGYNILEGASGRPYPKGNIKKIKTPYGEIVEFEDSLWAFAMKINIPPSAIHKLFNKQLKVYNGWTLPETIIETKTYIVQHKDGRKEEFSCVRDFAQKCNVTIGAVYHLLKGRCQYMQGWSLCEIK